MWSRRPASALNHYKLIKKYQEKNWGKNKFNLTLLFKILSNFVSSLKWL